MAVTITQALWGTGLDTNGVANVTSTAQSQYNQGTRTFHASREEWDVDPAYGHLKALLIEWNDEKGSHYGICPEGGSFTLPG